MGLGLRSNDYFIFLLLLGEKQPRNEASGPRFILFLVTSPWLLCLLPFFPTSGGTRRIVFHIPLLILLVTYFITIHRQNLERYSPWRTYLLRVLTQWLTPEYEAHFHMFKKKKGKRRVTRGPQWWSQGDKHQRPSMLIPGIRLPWIPGHQGENGNAAPSAYAHTPSLAAYICYEMQKSSLSPERLHQKGARLPSAPPASPSDPPGATGRRRKVRTGIPTPEDN